MRKLTGYIGAMIIVIALMGSILAGYALNINGTSTVMNEYEKVTDVSGLYTHTQEPSYIDYNPASNYIGYDYEKPFNSSVGDNNYYKSITYSTVIVCHSDGTVTYDNKTVTPVYVSPTVLFFTEWGWIHYNISSNILQWRGYGSTDINGDVTINITGNNVDITFNGTTKTITANNKIVVSDNSSYDYYYTFGALWNGVDNGKIAYFKDKSEIIGSTITGGSVHTFIGETYYYLDGGQSVNTTWPFTINNVESGIYSINPYYGTDLTVTFNGNNYLSSGLFVLYPKAVYKEQLGINYTESNRVNNYPVPNSSYNISSTSTQTINISNLSGITNYMPASNQYNITMYESANTGIYNNGSQNITVGNANYYMPASTLGSGNTQLGLLNYKLSDILTAGATIPANTKQIKIDLASNNSIAYNRNLNITNYIDYCDLNIPTLNNGVFETNNAYSNVFGNYTLKVNNGFGVKDYAIYDINDNIVTIYGYNGVKKSTLTPDNCYIASTNLNGYNSSNMILTYTAEQRTGSNNNTTWQTESYYYGGTIVQNYGYTNSNNFTTNIKLTYYISQTTDIKYFDITKGYSIKDTNIANTVWDNNYNNGKIQLLFRAQNTPGTYHNDIIVGDNSISIDYNPNKYLVSLNGADPVDIGTWRNIILDIDLINGELSAIPVRTFNNFTNVELDNTNIFIGDLINPTQTNIIEWAPTTNSLMFNIYNTSVFMNTYGVVMVNPTLNITSYFTDLNNFYQLKIYNISIYGQSMTINGVTGTVTGNNITFNNETVQIKDMSITYADGHAYISDSHVTIDLGEITDNTISMAGSWYFITDLMRGYTTYKMVYEWDWQDFILDNVQFCVIYIGLALIGLLIARHYCTLTITDYAIFLVSIVITLTIQVIA